MLEHSNKTSVFSFTFCSKNHTIRLSLAIKYRRWLCILFPAWTLSACLLSGLFPFRRGYYFLSAKNSGKTEGKARFLYLLWGKIASFSRNELFFWAIEKLGFLYYWEIQLIFFCIYIIILLFISYSNTMEKEKFHKDAKNLETTSDDEDEDGVGIPHVFVTWAFMLASFYAYFAGYQLRFKNLNLGAYSFLVVGILFLIAFAYGVYQYIQDKKAQK